MSGRAARRALAAGRLVGPAIGSGLLLALSVPAWGWWPLAFLGAALLYRHLAGLSFWRRLLSGWLAGLGLFVPGLIWTQAFNWYGALVLMVIEALSTAVAAALVPPDRGRLPVYVGAFTLLEALRMTWPFGGLPVGGVSLGQAGGPLLDTARMGGPLLLTAIVFLGGGALAELAGWSAARWGRSWPAVARVVGPQKNAAGGAIAALLVVALGAIAVLAPDGGSPVGSVVVAAVQGGGRRGVSNPRLLPRSSIRRNFVPRLDSSRIPRPGPGRPWSSGPRTRWLWISPSPRAPPPRSCRVSPDGSGPPSWPGSR